MAADKKASAVNETLKLPLADAFERDVTAILDGDPGEGPSVIALIDFDHFLQINEAFGHAQGDRVLIEAGEYLRANLPEGAAFYRIGGDEFGVLFPRGMEKEEALLLLDALRRAYQGKCPDGTPISLSMGVAAAFEDGVRYPDLLRKADGALFRAKVSGRNRVALAREEKMVTKTSHYTADQLQRLTKLSKREGIGEAILLREALDALLRKYDI